MALLYQPYHGQGRAVSAASQYTEKQWHRSCGRLTQYTPAEIPISRNFKEMSKKEMETYFQWFLDVMPERVSALADLVRETNGFGAWQPDRTPASLDPLGHWFSDQVEARSRTEEEIQSIRQRLAFPVDIPHRELTSRSLSIAFDVGVYLAEVLLANFPTALQWTKFMKNKKYLDYGQPVLSGFKSVTMNPVRIAVVLAYALMDKTQSGGRLKEIYDTWSGQIPQNVH